MKTPGVTRPKIRAVGTFKRTARCVCLARKNEAMIRNMRAARPEGALNVFVQKRRGSMYLEEETGKKSEVISCIFSLNEEVGALAKALRLFEVS